ncbi:MAG: 3-dehydroquinate synthase [Planctomycetales bacterium]|nr:3-dehydroquinate synthase [Planctomycetales bacterium]
MKEVNNSELDERLETVDVFLGDRSYGIQIGNRLLERLSDLMAEAGWNSKHAVLVADSQIPQLSQIVSSGLESSGWRVSTCYIPSGEGSKSVEQASRLWQQMLDSNTDRGSTVIALGGGVVGDLAGFAAATFARGLPLLQIPTTLLSQVDSSVGGKTGINLPGAKNIVGAFWQPRMVVIDLQTLNSLPHREFVSGLAEVVKYGVILLPELFEYLDTNAQSILDKQPAALSHIIAESCRAKALVVAEDERETTGRRAILNYGHTFAHALESVCGYGKLLHGEAVAIGMQMAARLALSLGRISSELVERQESLLKKLQLPVACPGGLSVEQLWKVMQHDKKVEHGKLRFILPSRMGQVELVNGIEQEAAIKAMQVA